MNDCHLEYRVRSIGNDAEAEQYLNEMAKEHWVLERAVAVGGGAYVQYVHNRAIKVEGEADGAD